MALDMTGLDFINGGLCGKSPGYGKGYSGIYNILVVDMPKFQRNDF